MTENTYQKFVGKAEIKDEISKYIFKKFTQWVFKRKLEMKPITSIQMFGKSNSNKAMHFIFPLKQSDDWIYNSNYDASNADSINLCIYVGAETIDFRIYLNGDETFTFSNPITFLSFNYIDILKDTKLLVKQRAKLIVDNKQAMNQCIQMNIIDFVIDLLDYFVIQKKIPKELGYDNSPYWIGVNDFSQNYVDKFLNNKYIKKHTVNP